MVIFKNNEDLQARILAARNEFKARSNILTELRMGLNNLRQKNHLVSDKLKRLRLARETSLVSVKKNRADLL
jgi:hypothetical protein